MGKWLDWVLGQIYVHLILPFRQTHAPISHVAWGTSIGLFVGLTPTVGIQMYGVAALWMLCRYACRFRFNLPVAVAMVWISNPVTFIPMYYGYLVTGEWLLQTLGHPVMSSSYAAFVAQMDTLHSAIDAGLVSRLIGGIWLLLAKFGWPMLVGSLVYAIPIALLAYPVITLSMLNYRRRLARQLGISYEQWKALRIHPE